jgi:choline dehydrogenase
MNTAQYLSNLSILSAQGQGSGRIDIRTECLATSVLFQPNSTRVIGVNLVDGQSLYRADPRAQEASDGVAGM